MPEGPEVTIITEGLHKELSGHNLLSFSFNEKSRYGKKAPNGFSAFETTINELKNTNKHLSILSVSNKGKFIYWKFSNGFVMFQTLGMSGGWFRKPKLHSGVILQYQNQVSGKVGTLYFDDQRHFATLKFFQGEEGEKELAKKLKSIGPDLLNDKDFTKSDFVKIFQKPKYANKIIARAVMDQKIVSGIGNYLRSESLYKAKINPHKEIQSLTKKDLERLYQSTRMKIVGSYNVGGASIRHYSDIENKKGQFEFKMEIYGKKTTPDGKKVIAEKIGGDGQTTYWCPDVQV